MITTVTIEPQYNNRSERIYVVVERDFVGRGERQREGAIREIMSSRSYAALVEILHPPHAKPLTGPPWW